MAYTKNFPLQIEGSTYTQWVEISLTYEEELVAEQEVQQEHKILFIECIEEAKSLFSQKGLKDYQTDIVNTAISLFEKRASHVVFHKDAKCREKFEQKYKK